MYILEFRRYSDSKFNVAFKDTTMIVNNSIKFGKIQDIEMLRTGGRNIVMY
jgi:hypothetical protein